MEMNNHRLRENELKVIVKSAITIAEESCLESFKSKTLSGDLGMQRYIFQESFRMVLQHMLDTREGTSKMQSPTQQEDIFGGMNEHF